MSATTAMTPPTVQEALAEARRRCAGQAPVADDCAHLLALALGVPRSWLLTHGTQTLQAAAIRRFEALLARRLAGEPLAYLRGWQGFWTLELEVTPDVLVPRPETERLVELALARMGERGALVDLGTGSGAIALALKSERPQWRITATDRSAAALAVAARNAARLGLDVECLPGDWYAPLAGRRFDVIVSNPPYVAPDDPCLAGDGLRREPRAALAAADAGLADLASITTGALAHLAPGGWLLLEHGADQGEAVRALLTAAGFSNIQTHADLAGHPRVTLGQTPCAN
ncbi:peptide chain release factor N(5)-glutamine methyltransferase [Immundisolibacter sp.]|uniref:peptide chain release factor N(5)-glutamine methyltransferase n=1 Tax=Immundisolibacter sp. TaxID=1934948 RepID=UPI00260353F4|nr:peptide chain release factor N(5)-glutamine methyltransferase [Immundisolibacter sp.]MDD3651094.1 peptide chain release factor N(5)-glutamine methyltransferase [Immundisolibacter sp.]